MKKFTRFNVLLLILAVTVASCAAIGQKPITAKQQGAIWMTVYNAVYDDTLATLINPSATALQKEIAIKKKDILLKVWPLLKTYTAIVDTGSIPSSSDATAITDLINQLVALGGS